MIRWRPLQYSRREDSSLDHVGRGEGVQRWNTGSVWKVDTTDFFSQVDPGKEGERTTQSAHVSVTPSPRPLASKP